MNPGVLVEKVKAGVATAARACGPCFTLVLLDDIYFESVPPFQSSAARLSVSTPSSTLRAPKSPTRTAARLLWPVLRLRNCPKARRQGIFPELPPLPLG